MSTNFDYSQIRYLVLADWNIWLQIGQINLCNQEYFSHTFKFISLKLQGRILLTMFWIYIYAFMCSRYIYIHYRQKYGIFRKHSVNTRICHFNLVEMVWHQRQTSIVTLIQISCVLLWTKSSICIFRHQRYTKGCSRMYFLISHLKSFTTSRPSIITLWKCCVYSMICYWHPHNLRPFFV